LRRLTVRHRLCTGPVTTGEAIDTATAEAKSFAVTATDAAGNTTTVTHNYTVTELPPIDETAPAITPSVIGTPGTNGWYTSNVSVSWAVTDPESPIDSQSGCDEVSVTVDTSDTTLTCTATSAGGTSSESVTIRRDATAPSVTIVNTA
jgi:hypothetical protein